MHKQILLVATIIALAFTVALNARTFEPQEGWGSADQTEKAIEYAKKKELPLALVYFTKSSDCPKCIGPQTQIERDRTLNKMARVMIFDTDPKPSALTEAQRQSASFYTGSVHILDGDKNLIAVASNASQLGSATSQATKVIAWKRKVDNRLKTALSQAERGLFDKALDEVAEIEDEDKTLTNNLIKVLNKQKKENFKEIKEQNPNATEESFGIKKDDEEAEEVPGIFFAGLMDEYRPKIEELAKAQLEEAKAAFEKEDYIAARRLLAPMVRNECEFDAVKEARELIETVEAEHKAKMQSARN